MRMEKILQEAFNHYPAAQAPFLHQQYADWQRLKPLQGLRVAHHFPVVQNTLLKIACLAAAGAEVTVTNPDFMQACPQALIALQKNNIKFVENVQTLTSTNFDIYLDCGAVLYTTLGMPKIGAIELTGTGDKLYRQLNVSYPVISIDRSLTKQLETVFGTAVSAMQAMMHAKQPINFVLNDPTPIIYIDPEMYVHNQVTLDLLAQNLSHQIHNMPSDFDNATINQWCDYHGQTRQEIERWFIQF